MNRTFGILIGCAMTVSSAHAQPAKQFAVEEAGRFKCAAYTAARQDKNSGQFQRMMGFVEGYLTAANRYEPGTFDLTPWHNREAFDIIIKNHCLAHKNDSLVSVVQRMVIGFRNFRVAQYSPMVEVRSGQYSTTVYDAVLRRSQQALKLRGLYNGEEDGRFSPALREAFAKFQKSKNLNVTGIPDPGTLWTLLNP